MRYAINQQHVSSRTLDAAAVIVNHQNGHYYSLNRTGTLLWELLGEQEMSLEELASALGQRYNKPPAELVQDTRNLVEEMTRENLLVAKE